MQSNVKEFVWNQRSERQRIEIVDASYFARSTPIKRAHVQIPIQGDFIAADVEKILDNMVGRLFEYCCFQRLSNTNET